MSMVARTNPGPAEDDITDTDDGDTRISAGAFWPDIVLRTASGGTTAGR
ncbi:putative phage head completion protein [Escherichia coli 178200]|nr:putative phage head completion protein [Escherichia coli 178200]